MRWTTSSPSCALHRPGSTLSSDESGANPRTAIDRAAGRLALASRLGWEVADEALLAHSLAHRSWCAEHPEQASNERLEFLGDSVLGLVITDHLYRRYPDLSEGELAKIRASVVNASALAEVAGELGVGAALLLGKGESQSGGGEKPSILADAMEALLGAIYLDRGWGHAATIVMALLGDRIEEAAAGPGGQDYKTRLQELCARRFDALPAYSVRNQGPDHAKEFDAVVEVDGRLRGAGRGRSKKQAEQAAARAAWESLLSIAGGPAGVAREAAGAHRSGGSAGAHRSGGSAGAHSADDAVDGLCDGSFAAAVGVLDDDGSVAAAGGQPEGRPGVA